jgi:hypothetical protein
MGGSMNQASLPAGRGRRVPRRREGQSAPASPPWSVELIGTAVVSRRRACTTGADACQQPGTKKVARPGGTAAADWPLVNLSDGRYYTGICGRGPCVFVALGGCRSMAARRTT